MTIVSVSAFPPLPTECPVPLHRLSSSLLHSMPSSVTSTNMSCMEGERWWKATAKILHPKDASHSWRIWVVVVWDLKLDRTSLIQKSSKSSPGSWGTSPVSMNGLESCWHPVSIPKGNDFLWILQFWDSSIQVNQGCPVSLSFRFSSHFKFEAFAFLRPPRHWPFPHDDLPTCFSPLKKCISPVKRKEPVISRDPDPLALSRCPKRSKCTNSYCHSVAS